MQPSSGCWYWHLVEPLLAAVDHNTGGAHTAIPSASGEIAAGNSLGGPSAHRWVLRTKLQTVLPVSLIPFAAAVLDDYHDEPIALHLYGAVLIAASLARVLLFAYVGRRPALLSEPIGSRARRFGLLVSAAPIVLYLLAIVLADPAPAVSLAVYFLVPAAYFVLITVLRDRPATAADAGDFS